MITRADHVQCNGKDTFPPLDFTTTTTTKRILEVEQQCWTHPMPLSPRCRAESSFDVHHNHEEDTRSRAARLDTSHASSPTMQGRISLHGQLICSYLTALQSSSPLFPNHDEDTQSRAARLDTPHASFPTMQSRIFIT